VFIILNMSLLWRTSRRSSPPGPLSRTTPGGDRVFRDVALVCLADGIVGVSFGAIAVAGGLPWWVPVAMSLLVFAGGSQFAATSVVLAGGGPVAAVAAGALLNARLAPYGFAVAHITGRNWWTRLAGAQVTTDESVAFALREADEGQARRAFWACGVTLYAVWNLAVAGGVLAGSAIRNTAAFGLDATFPAVLLALALPTITARRTKIASGTGAVIAVALTPVLPAGLPVLTGLAGLATLLSRPATHQAVLSLRGASARCLPSLRSLVLCLRSAPGYARPGGSRGYPPVQAPPSLRFLVPRSRRSVHRPPPSPSLPGSLRSVHPSLRPSGSAELSRPARLSRTALPRGRKRGED
jgi:predicted branched-subunit amino acid permease